MRVASHISARFAFQFSTHLVDMYDAGCGECKMMMQMRWFQYEGDVDGEVIKMRACWTRVFGAPTSLGTFFYFSFLLFAFFV